LTLSGTITRLYILKSESINSLHFIIGAFALQSITLPYNGLVISLASNLTLSKVNVPVKFCQDEKNESSWTNTGSTVSPASKKMFGVWLLPNLSTPVKNTSLPWLS
jgi:hypothetical protein